MNEEAHILTPSLVTNRFTIYIYNDSFLLLKKIEHTITLFSKGTIDNIGDCMQHIQSQDEVSIIISNKQFTLSPIDIIDDKEALLAFNVDKPTESSYASSKSVKHQVETLFYINTNLLLALNQLFPSASIKHHSSVLIDSCKQNTTVFLHEDNMEIVLQKNGKLHFYNCFTLSNKEESLYYLALALEQLNLTIQETTIHVGGDIKDKEILFEYWNSFIPKENLIFLKDEAVSIAQQVENLNPAHYFSLIP